MISPADGHTHSPDLADAQLPGPAADSPDGDVGDVGGVGDDANPAACSPADVAFPPGDDIADVLAFMDGFRTGSPEIDLAPPRGRLDIADIVTFLRFYGAGCP